MYLQQDLVRQFIEADNDQQRFEAVSEIVGAGRVTELSLALERAKTAWSRATNTRAKDLEGAERQLNALQGQLSSLTHQTKDDADLEATWNAWWQRTTELIQSQLTAPPAQSSEAPRALDNSVKLIDTQRRSLERRAELVEELLGELKDETGQHKPVADTAGLKQAVTNASTELASARQELEQAQGEAAAQRRLQLELGETRAEPERLLSLRCATLEQLVPFALRSTTRQALGDDSRRLRQRALTLPRAPAMSPRPLVSPFSLQTLRIASWLTPVPWRRCVMLNSANVSERGEHTSVTAGSAR